MTDMDKIFKFVCIVGKTWMDHGNIMSSVQSHKNVVTTYLSDFCM